METIAGPAAQLATASGKGVGYSLQTNGYFV